MNKTVDIISRKAETKTSLINAGNLNVSLQEPSVLVIHGSSTEVVRYERQGNDLLIVMKDGSVIRCNGYFIEDSEEKYSELVFQNDSGALTHITFADIGSSIPVEMMILEPTETTMADIQTLLYGSSDG
ncbi:BapA/Bap/LapF family prefix-like domain-containing protein [Budvicia aquatica]|nr:BapA prefix-like domain-containing protein [Budvicia aquatica]VFS49194.1 Uncharacterised protein [Budvicia aquatica]